MKTKIYKKRYNFLLTDEKWSDKIKHVAEANKLQSDEL